MIVFFMYKLKVKVYMYIFNKKRINKLILFLFWLLGFGHELDFFVFLFWLLGLNHELDLAEF